MAVDPPFEGPGTWRDPWAQPERFDPSRPDLLFDYPVRPGISEGSPVQRQTSVAPREDQKCSLGSLTLTQRPLESV